MKKTLSDGRVAQLKSQVNALKLVIRLLYRGVLPACEAVPELERIQAALYSISQGHKDAV